VSKKLKISSSDQPLALFRSVTKPKNTGSRNGITDTETKEKIYVKCNSPKQRPTAQSTYSDTSGKETDDGRSEIYKLWIYRRPTRFTTPPVESPKEDN
jgi:hypothetical protein